MNEAQRLYLVQARSDWSIFQALKDAPVCHRLHYLQMCTEKLGKAFYWRGKGHGAGNLGHAAFVKFLRAINRSPEVSAALGFHDTAGFGEWIDDVSDLAYELERLAPALSGDGPNPEYPWPRANPRYSPVEYEFAIWER